MDFTTVYPNIEPKPAVKQIIRALLSLTLFVGCLTCAIVNLCVGGSPWYLYVIGGSVLFWTIFLYQPIVEFSLLHRIAAILPAICAYLFLIDWLSGESGFSKLVVPIVLFSVFVLCLLLFFIRFKRQKHNVFPLYSLSLLILALIIFAAVEETQMEFNWPIIVLAALDGLLLVLTTVFFFPPIAREFKKKFHTK